MCVCKGILRELDLFSFLWVCFYILRSFPRVCLLNLCCIYLLLFLFDIIRFFAKGGHSSVIWMIVFYYLFLFEQDRFHPLEADSDCS